MKFIIIVGLPASGKTTLANSLAMQNENAIVIDDPDNESFLDDLKETVVYITHPIFCILECRTKLINEIKIRYHTAEIEFIFFENNKEACLKNARNRTRKVDGMIKHLSSIYDHPKVGLIPVWK